jgi:hypothetical protein
VERTLHSIKLIAWWAISSKGIVGPLWFEDENSRALTVNKERYQDVLRQFCSILRQQEGDNNFESQWFQQDGAPPHTANTTMELLEAIFGDRIISKRKEFFWARHSPDLSPLDYFLWGYCKENVYANKPSTLSELKQNIEEFIRSIPSEMCVRVIRNLSARLQRCIDLHGAHIEHVTYE